MKKAAKKIYIILCLVFLYLPIAVLIIFSFNDSKNRALFTGFTLKWYQNLFNNDLIMSSLFNTLLVAVISAIVATIAGTITCLGINAMKKRARNTIMNVTYLPVINPDIITGVSLMIMFVFICNIFNNILGTHFELGFWSVLIAHISFGIPYVILNVLPKMRQMDPYLYEAAIDLGCSPAKAFMKVVVPQILPGVASGFLMAFTFSLDDFTITYFTSGSSFQTLPVTIYSMTRMKINPQINALSTIIFVVVLLLLVMMNIRTGKKKGAENY